MGQTLFEMFWMLDRSPANALRGVEVRGMDEVRRAAGRGKGVMLVSAHAGNWELISMALAMEKIAPVVVIARALSTPGLERKQKRCRERAGIKTLVRGEKGVGVTAYRWLKKGGVLGVMMDRLSAGRRIAVPLLGNATWMPLGPLKLACRSGAAVVLGLSERMTDGGIVVRFRELPAAGVTSAVEMAKVISSALDDGLRGKPEQWYWIYRRQPKWRGEYIVTEK
jgi:KDO2-lipid IV(A) lauroyltransferase